MLPNPSTNLPFGAIAHAGQAFNLSISKHALLGVTYAFLRGIERIT